MSISIQPVATAYIRRGWSPIPIPFKTKAPLVRGWQQLRIDQAEVSKHFSHPEQNIGVLLGEPSGWLVDIDLDHERCVELADEFLPATPAIFGRPGKPRSHRLYRVTKPVATRKFKSKSAGMLVELRSTGTQTVFPPSIHESGEPITWETENAEPTEIDPDVLMAAVKSLADAVKRELGELAEPKDRNPDAAETSDVNEPVQSAERTMRCLDAMRRIKVADNNDGSGRLFAVACRCIEHDLSSTEAITAIRAYESERPFPRLWTDDELEKRLIDAETKCKRGIALQQPAFPLPSEGRPSQADALVFIAQEAEFFHFDEDAYVSFDVNDHRETARVNSKAFRNWLSRKHYETTLKVAGSQALQDALSVLAGQALYSGPELPVAVRCAEHDGAIYFDLVDQERRGVRIDATGWQVLSSYDIPVRFLRRKAMLPLPVPQRGGSVSLLRKFLNLRDQSDWALILGWLVAALRPNGPFTVLHLNGEQGTAKSTLSRLLRSLVDPNRAPLRSEPREPRDLMIAASNSRVVAFDNLSGLPLWLSDALCRLATGGGFATRELFTNEDEVIFDAMRPVIINGIEPAATRPDLVDRCLNLHLEVIPEGQRRTEADLWRDFESVRGVILGALYTAVSAAMGRVNSVKLPSVPRMADFCVWVIAAEAALQLPEGAFLSAYQGDRASAQELIIENSVVGSAICRLLEAKGDWAGTPAELLLALNNDSIANEGIRRTSEWPKSPRKLSGEVRRLAPPLRGVGVAVTVPTKRTGREKHLVVRLERVEKTPSAPTACSANGVFRAENADGMRSVAAHVEGVEKSTHTASMADSGPITQVADGAECAERQIPNCSNPDGDDEKPEVVEL